MNQKCAAAPTPPEQVQAHDVAELRIRHGIWPAFVVRAMLEIMIGAWAAFGPVFPFIVTRF